MHTTDTFQDHDMDQQSLCIVFTSVMPECPAISRPFPKYTYTNSKEFSLPGDLYNDHTVSGLFSSINNEQSLQDHFPSRTLLMFCDPEDLNNKYLFPTVSNEWTFQDDLLSITLPTQTALSSERPEQSMCRVFPSVTDKGSFQDHHPSKTPST